MSSVDAQEPGFATMALDRLPDRRPARVERIVLGSGALSSARTRQLAAIGFVPGETVAVLSRAWPGGDPLVVRVGQSCFALRGAEAACVHVRPMP